MIRLVIATYFIIVLWQKEEEVTTQLLDVNLDISNEYFKKTGCLEGSKN